MRTWLATLGLGARTKPRDVQSIVTSYGQVLASRKQIMCDFRELPCPKLEIKAALFGALSVTPPGPIRDQLRVAFVSLGNFQDLAECRRMNQNPDSVAITENVALAQEHKALEATLEDNR